MRLIIKLLNIFEFESHILILINQQRRKIKAITKILCSIMEINLVPTTSGGSIWPSIMNKVISIKENNKDSQILMFFDNIPRENEEILDYIMTYARISIFRPWEQYE